MNERAVEVDIEMGGKGVLSGEPALSTLWAPLVVAGESTGVISLQNLDREFAFTEADMRLLTTLASSLSVALENARLIDTTKRLLTEADERAAELAIINGVQQGLAAQIDMQAMYDLVGDKLREVFDAQVVDIGILDPDEGRFHFPYTIERGVRYDDRPLERDRVPPPGRRDPRPGPREPRPAGSRRGGRAAGRHPGRAVEVGIVRPDGQPR